MPIYGLRYMKDFACLGSDCPATCCQGWGIHLDREGYKKLQSRQEDAPKPLNERKWFRVLGQDKRTDAVFALAEKTETGHCTALDNQGLCDIHKNFGPQYLPPICDTFPRRVFRENDNLMVYGEVSCPPIAERVLTESDALMFDELVDFPDERAIPKQILISEESSTYENAQEIFREVGIHLLTIENYSLEQRLLALLEFSKRVSTILEKRSQTIDEEAFEACISEFSSSVPPTPEYQEVLSDEEGIQVSLRIISLLANHTNPANQPHFTALLEQIFEQFQGISPVGEQEGEPVLSQEDRIGKWTLENLRRLETRHEGLFSVFLVKVAIHSWLSRPYRKHPDLLHYTTELTGILHVFRFCVANHPKVIALGEESTESDFTAIASQTLFSIARCLEHGPVLSHVLKTAKQVHSLNQETFHLILAKGFPRAA